MKGTLRSLSTLAAATAMTAFAGTQAPYANDFTTRTSGATPSARWVEAAYTPGTLARNLASASITAVSPYAGDCQDGWAAKQGWSNGAVTYAVAADGGNQGLLANGTGSGYANSSSVIVQPLGNEFTSGTLRVSVDIRTPPQGDSFNPGSNAFAMLAPVYKAALDITSTSFPIPLRFGPGSMSHNGQWNLRSLSRGKTSASAGGSNFGQYDTRNAIVAGDWIRYEAIVNLDAGTYTATFASLGVGHPTPDSAAGTAYDFRTYEPGGGGSAAPTTLYFDSAMTEETGGVAGLAFFTYGLKQANAADAPMFDNVRVWHDGELVYENDFATRRYRQIEPAATTVGAYAITPITNSVSSATYSGGSWANEYGATAEACGFFVPTSTAELDGQDGWRRIAGNNADFSIINPNKDGGRGWNNGGVLRVTKEYSRGYIATPIGSIVTNGKVRLYFDLRQGSKTRVSSSVNAGFALCMFGGDSAYSAAYSTQTAYSKVLSGKGVCGTGYYKDGTSEQQNNPIVLFNGSGKADYRNASGSTVAADRSFWHRYVVTADLDARTFSTLVYQYGTIGQKIDWDHTGATIVAEDNNRAFADVAPSNIDSIIIATQGNGNYNSTASYTIDGVSEIQGKFPLFDNLRVCLVNADGSDGLDLFRCDFEGSVRTAVREAAPLKTGIGGEGADRWTARGTAHGSINVLADAAQNQTAVLAGSSGGAGFVVQSSGAVTKNCASANFAADIRPPSFWSRSDGQAFAEVGGDAYYQGVTSPAGDWRATAPRLSFGFACDTSTKTYGRYESVKIAVATQTGMTLADAAVDSTHWYRFRVKANIAQNTCSINVFDQGTTAPAASAADGNRVATFSNVALPAFGTDGITTFGIGGSGIPATYGGGLDDPAVALIDNLSAEIKSGSTFYIIK